MDRSSCHIHKSLDFDPSFVLSQMVPLLPGLQKRKLVSILLNVRSCFNLPKDSAVLVKAILDRIDSLGHHAVGFLPLS